jgi:hypothetical protein
LEVSLRWCGRQAKNLERGENLETGSKVEHSQYAGDQQSGSLEESAVKIMSGEGVKASTGCSKKNPRE